MILSLIMIRRLIFILSCRYKVAGQLKILLSVYIHSVVRVTLVSPI